MKKEWKKFLALGVSAFLVFLAVHYWTPFVSVVGIAFRAATPLLIGCIMAYILNILMSFYEKHYFPNSSKAAARKSARPVCMLAAFLTLLLIIAFVLRLVVPELITCVKLLLAGIPNVMVAVSEWLGTFEYLPEEIAAALQGVDWNATLTKLFGILTSGIGSTVNFAVGAVSSVASLVMNLVIGAIFAVYLLIGKERLLAQFSRLMNSYLRPALNGRLRYVLGVTNGCFHKYIVGQCTEAVILGALCAIGMFIFRFPYAVMTGVVIGVTALIPVAGAYIGGAVGFLLILSSESFMQALMFLVYLVVLQQLEGNLIYPRVVGTSIGLPGIWVLAVVTIGGGICGIPGMLLGVPLAASAYQLIKNDLNKKALSTGPDHGPATQILKHPGDN